MSIAPNKVIIPDDYKEIILNETNGDPFVTIVDGSTTTSGVLNVVTIDLPNLNLNINPKMSYVAEVCYICEESYCEIKQGNKEGDPIDQIIEFKIIIDKNTASKYRFFRFSLTPKVDIYNNTEEIRGVPTPPSALGPILARPCPIRVYIKLNITIKDSDHDIFLVPFTRSLTTLGRTVPSGSKFLTGGAYMPGMFTITFKFLLDSLNGTITDETPDVFGTIMTSPTNVPI